MFQVVCFGEILWDNLPGGKKPGGAPLNVAIHLHKQGINSILVSSIGTDQDGKELEAFIRGNGLSTEHLQYHNTLRTGIVDVSLDADKQATYTISKPVAWDEINHTDALQSIVGKADALVFGSLVCRSDISRNTLLELLKATRLAVFDMNLRPPHFEQSLLERMLKSCHLLKLNEHELHYLGTIYTLSGGIEMQLRQLGTLTGASTICVTLGEEGAALLSQGNFYHHAGFPVEVADTVGAGDAFLSRLISGLLRNEEIKLVLEKACATGAFVASRSGATPDYTEEDIQKVGTC